MGVLLSPVYSEVSDAAVRGACRDGKRCFLLSFGIIRYFSVRVFKLCGRQLCKARAGAPAASKPCTYVENCLTVDMKV